MSKRGRYYLGRVIKLGQLNQKTLISAIKEAASVTVGKFTWTITDIQDSTDEPLQYIYGALSKYSREGHVTVVDTDTKSRVEAIAPNLHVASAPFVYLPEYSGIAFLHVWNHVQEDLFPRRFKTVIEATHKNFFVECSIEPISDYRAFVQKLSGIEKFTELSAKVHPPNPLFGEVWKSLKDYVVRRNASEVLVKESREDGGGIKTKLLNHVQSMLQNPNYVPDEPADITDAAIMMAADGYGSGKIVGEQDGSEVIIKTADTQKSFSFFAEPTPESLAEEAHKHFKRLNTDRNLKH
jgi:hypothetical protein